MQREPIVSQYHQLRDHLNRANKLANQKMELEFKIEQYVPDQYRLFAISKNEHESHRIALAERGRNKTWERTGFTRYRQLEEFCAFVLNDREKYFGKKSKIKQIESEEISTLQQVISEKIKMLLLNAGYEP